ncbi:MAG: hypothetical protein R3A46_11050 [Thermomicrobiales bacterium]
MLDELLEIFERDRQRGGERRGGIRGFFDRFNEDEDDERARRSHSRSHHDTDYEYDEDGWYDDRRSRR